MTWNLYWLRLRRHLRSLRADPLGARALTARVAVLLHPDPAAAPATPPRLAARLSVPGRWHGRIERVAQLDPYLLETLYDDAVAAGPAARLEVVLAAGASDADLAWVRTRFAPLRTRGVAADARRASVPQPRRAARAA